MGQSNAAGADARPILSATPSHWGNLMFARGVRTWERTYNAQTPLERPATDFALASLVASQVESRATGLADHLKGGILATAAPVSDRDQVLVSAVTEGSRLLTELGPENHAASGEPGAAPPGGFWPTLLDDITRGKAAAAVANYKYELPFWNYDQGESEAGQMNVYRNRPAGTASQLISQYTQRAVTMVQTFDREVRSRVGKASATPCLVTPACYNTLTPTAWLKASDATPLAVVVGPRYQMPSALAVVAGATSAIHYCADGQRWIGEMVAKVGAAVLAGNTWRPMRALRATRVSISEIDVHCHVPHGPIVLDTASWPAIDGWGFGLYSGEVGSAPRPLLPTSVRVEDAAVIRLKFLTIPAGAKLCIGGSGMYQALSGLPIVAVGSATLGGKPAVAITTQGDVSEVARRALADGPVIAQSDSGAGVVVRSFERSGTRTTFFGQTSEFLRTDRTFAPGVRLFVKRAQPATNVRDSDNTPSLYRFAQGPRAGQAYPLHNWLATYDGLPVEGT